MHKRRVLTNAVMSIIQVIVNGGVLFLLYRFLLKALGAEQLGIWSLVLATTSITNVASFGLSGSVVKFVAKYLARGEDETSSRVIQTASISIAFFIGMGLLIAYPVIRKILGIVVVPEHLPLALLILPYSLLSLWIMAITGVFQSGLDGAQRIYLRNYISMSGAFLYLVLCLIFVPHYGLKGAAYSQVIQSFLIFLCSWILLRRIIHNLPMLPIKWDKNIFREIIGYGINFQLISITTMFYDPVTKALLSKFGGLSMVGYYEMANKMVQQFRALIVSANQVLVPAIADLQERTPERIKDIYITSYQLLFYLALPLYSLIIISIPAISVIWIGHYEKVFVIFGTILVIGAFLNTLAGPAYFANLGIGDLRWNLISHIVIGLLNAGMGFLFGTLFNGAGVVVAWVIALSLGSSLIYLSYHIKNEVPLRELVPESSRTMLFVCSVISVFSLVFFDRFKNSIETLALNSAIILICCLFIFVPFYLHPMRKKLMGWMSEVKGGRERLS